MTFDDLSTTLWEAVETKRIGIPVALRLHLQLCDPQADLTVAMVASLCLVEPFFNLNPSRLMARRDSADRQLNVLLETADGRTVFVTVGRGSTGQATLHLLLIGNHGVVRLEGAQTFEEEALQGAASELSAKVDEWNTRIAQSVARNEAVAI